MEGLPQNWHFLTFPEHFLAARGHSLRNPDAFRSSLPAYNPMGEVLHFAMQYWSNCIRQKALREGK
ncbi:hypothetical protein [Robinsoniella sp. KNHs210]|uniref:hypothetical protein n=1 Tax=Robinsoniella sp. KNHs210 TaxID=1469950 RepID=UPI0012DCCA16|nr:hypothetical protein [Robinsoniella sp. KNHs210]